MRRYLFVLLFIAVSGLPFSAAQAADDPFAVAGVKVDASAASASEAFNIAVNGGRHAAWQTLIHRLTREQDWPQIPAIDDDTLSKMISGYQVSDERRSTTRYVASVTYTFNGDLVRRFLRGANIAYAASAAPPLLVVPLAPSYAPASAWTAAWAGNHMAAGAVPLQLPSGDALDATLLGPIEFGTASWTDVQPAASRAHASQVALVLAGSPSAGHMPVSIRILSPASVQMLPPVIVAVPPGTAPAKGYGDAMAAAAGAIGEAWKTRSAIDFNRHSSITAEVRLESLTQWGAIQRRLATVPIVMNVNVAAMNLGQARVVISYAGTPAQLKDFLSQAALALLNRDGGWWLSAQAADGGVTNP